MRQLGSGKDLDLYVTVVIAVVVGVLGALDVVGVGVVISATLATLALVAAGSLGSRRQVTRLIASVDELSTLLRQREVAPSADAFLTQSTSGLDIDLHGSSDIRMVGVTLSRTVRNHVVELEQRLLAGAVIRVALIEPGSDAVGEAARRSTIPDSPEIFENRLRPTIDLLSHLAARPGVLGRIEVRLLRFVPSFGLIMVDPDEVSGRIHVDIYSHRTAAPEPVLALSPHREPRWYGHFRREFDRIWEHGRVADLTPRAAAAPPGSP
jgi:hypothetical protein